MKTTAHKRGGISKIIVIVIVSLNDFPLARIRNILSRKLFPRNEIFF